MRKIIINRGLPGSGKSTLIEKAGLTYYSLSFDLVRMLYFSPEMNSSGHFGLNQSNNLKASAIFFEVLEQRMMRGELLVVDNTSLPQADINKFIKLAKAHRYDMLFLDYTQIPFEKIVQFNGLRAENKQVPLENLATMHRQAQNKIDYKGEKVVFVQDALTDFNYLNQWLSVPLVDLSHYKEVVHIGDLQGCLTVLLNGPLKEGFKDDTAYIFIGDYLDRGQENGAVFRWLYENALPRDNVYMMWGNHEDHIHRFSRGMPNVSQEFELRTLPQLKHAKITPQMADEFCNKLLDVLPYQWHDKKVLITHGGLSAMPPLERLALISRHQYGKGTGEWTDPVDEQFMRNATGEWHQVHGHRNHGMVGVQATPLSFNLEDEVEYGGNLRSVTLNANGWTPGVYRNHLYRKRRIEMSELEANNKPLYDRPPVWMTRDNETVIDGEIFDNLLSNKGVHLTHMKRHKNIISFNFKREVFNNKSWDDLLVKARGLFVNQRTMQIVARGYEKFFNVNERKETQMGELKQNLQFPVTCYVKENGFLGNLGYDADSDELFVASKASCDGEFAKMFKKILDENLNPDTQDRIRRWLRDNEASMVFEVIDPLNDPHMIDYDKAQLVLLDIFHRSTHPEKLDYDHLKAVGERFGLTVKTRGIQLKNGPQLEGFYKKVISDLSWRNGGADIEGFVLEDANGYQTKIKLPHYAFWKHMRTQKDRMGKLVEQKERMDPNSEANVLIQQMEDEKKQLKEDKMVVTEVEIKKQIGLRIRDLDLSINRHKMARQVNREFLTVDVNKVIEKNIKRDPHPLAVSFLGWASTQKSEDLFNKDILTLRKEFIQQINPKPELYKIPWVEFENVLAEDFDKGYEAPTLNTVLPAVVSKTMKP